MRLNVRNSGKIRHELVLGTDADLKAHYDMMMKDPGMRHEEANSISLDAGKSGQIVCASTRPAPCPSAAWGPVTTRRA